MTTIHSAGASDENIFKRSQRERFKKSCRSRQDVVHTNDAAASWSAPALWRFYPAWLATPKRQRAGALQNLAEIFDEPAKSSRRFSPKRGTGNERASFLNAIKSP